MSVGAEQTTDDGLVMSVCNASTTADDLVMSAVQTTADA